jgi:hypothetical protein
MEKETTANLLRFQKDQKFLIWDYETISLSLLPGKEKEVFNKPWQLSFLLATQEKVINSWDYYIWWDNLEIRPEVAAINHFDFHKYKERAQDPKVVIEEFEKHLYDPSVINVGQNILGFDIYVHNIYRHLLGKKSDYSYIQRSIDTRFLCAAIKKEMKFDRNNGSLIEWQFRLATIHEKTLKTSTLQQLKDHGINYDERKLHDSSYDILMNLEVFKKQLYLLEI